ncbi:Osiris 2 [Carabus blaptoides fortunei]
MLGCAKWLLLVTAGSLVALQSSGQYDQYNQLGQGQRQGKDLLDWLGLGTGPDTDPYLSKTNSACLGGDLAECFKSRALGSLDEFFAKPVYDLTENARVVRMPTSQLRQLAQEPYEYSSASRADEPEWDQLVKFVMRKAEKFLKSTAIEVQFPEQITEEGRYSPRFVDEIADEIDIIEDKKDSIFNRKKLKKLFIPLLIILKLFKLKLLLFLPLILGLASFKKLLGFLAIVIPGLIGFFKLCKPNLQSSFGNSNYYGSGAPHYSPAGVGYQHHYKEGPSFAVSHESNYQNQYYGNAGYSGGGLTFKDDDHNSPYSGYSEYRTASTDRTKSILPDS